MIKNKGDFHLPCFSVNSNVDAGSASEFNLIRIEAHMVDVVRELADLGNYFPRGAGISDGNVLVNVFRIIVNRARGSEDYNVFHNLFFLSLLVSFNQLFS